LNRDQKVTIIADLNESFSKAKLAVVADYCGLKVSELQKMRIELRQCDSEIRIAKNTLLKRAVQDTGSEALSESFTGTTAVVISYADPVAPAKILAKFADDFDKFKIRTAVLEGEKIDEAQLIALSKLPSKEVLLAKLLSTWTAVPTGLVRVLNGVPGKLVYALQAIKDQKEAASN